MHILNKTHYTIINTLPQVSAATAPSSGRNSVVCSKQYYNIWLQILRYVIHGFTILFAFIWRPYLVHVILKRVKWSRYSPGVAHRVGRGIALLFHDCGIRRGWVVSSTPRPHFTLEKEPVPILQEAGWASGPVWTGGKSRPHRDSIPDRPSRSQSLYRLSYPAHKVIFKVKKFLHKTL